MGAARQIGALLILSLLLTINFTHLGVQSNVSATPTVSIPILENVIHEGDIVLRGNETMTLDLVNYTQKGDIIVTDEAILRITHSTFRTSDDQRYDIIVNGSGRLWLWDSAIKGEQMIYMAGDASVYLDKCTLIGEGLFHDGTRYYLTGFGMEGNSSLEALRSSLGIVMIADNASCEVRDSFIGDFYPVSPVESIIRGSEIESLILSIRDADLEIGEGFHGYHENWETRAVFGEGCMANLRLVDTVILEPLQTMLINCSLVLRGDLTSVFMRNGSKVRVLNTNLWLLATSSEDTHIEVENSTVHYLRGGPFMEGDPTYSLKGSRLEEANILSLGEMSVTIEDCSFGSLQVGSLFSSDRPANVDVRDTVIGNLTIVTGGRFTYDFENVTVEVGFQLGEGSIGGSDHAILRGSLRFGENAIFGGGRRSNANIIRWYDIEFRPPRRGSVTLELKRGNETIWTRDIDREGVTEFSINYLDYFRLVLPYVAGKPSAIDLFNMTDTFTLIATTPEASEETRVGLLTDTPILLELEPGASPGEESPFTSAILLAVALVVAFILWTRLRR